MSTPGAALIRGMAAGDRDALARFYDRYAPAAYALVLTIVGERADAAALLEDAVWECWRSARTFDPEGTTPEAWVLARARARALDRVRSIRRGGDIAVAPARDAEPGEGWTGTPPARGMITRVLDSLPETHRAVIVLAYYGGLTQTEIAARLKQPLGTIKTRLQFGLDRLREAARLAP